MVLDSTQPPLKWSPGSIGSSNEYLCTLHRRVTFRYLDGYRKKRSMLQGIPRISSSAVSISVWWHVPRKILLVIFLNDIKMLELVVAWVIIDWNLPLSVDCLLRTNDFLAFRNFFHTFRQLLYTRSPCLHTHSLTLPCLAWPDWWTSYLVNGSYRARSRFSWCPEEISCFPPLISLGLAWYVLLYHWWSSPARNAPWYISLRLTYNFSLSAKFAVFYGRFQLWIPTKGMVATMTVTKALISVPPPHTTPAGVYPDSFL